MPLASAKVSLRVSLLTERRSLSGGLVAINISLPWSENELKESYNLNSPLTVC
jgi:hypothetical protein